MCFCLVVPLMALIMLRVMHSFAKDQKEEAPGEKSRIALNRPIIPSCSRSSSSAPCRK